MIEELETINGKSFEMALRVLNDGKLRETLSGEAAILRKRLLIIADELKDKDEDLYRKWSSKISESMLDLFFVEFNTGIVSLRLSDIIRWS